MADERISQLTEVTSPALTDILPITVDPSGSAITKKVTLGNLKVSAKNVIAAQVLASFTNTSGAHEHGETVNNFSLNWTYNRNADNPTSQIIDVFGSITPTSLRTYAVTGAGLTDTATATMTAIGDDATNSSLTTTIPFYWKRYFGVYSGDILTGANVMSILNPLNSEYGTSRAKSNAFTFTGDAYFYFAYPSAWGAVAGWIFNGFTQSTADLEYSNGTSFGSTPTALTLTNASGGTATYYIVRGKYKYNGETDTISIS